jgi:hypothetical protein
MFGLGIFDVKKFSEWYRLSRATKKFSKGESNECKTNGSSLDSCSRLQKSD